MDNKNLKYNKRLEDNKIILKVLSEYIENNPTVRFSQALANLNIVDRYQEITSSHYAWTDDYYSEPERILRRMKLKD